MPQQPQLEISDVDSIVESVSLFISELERSHERRHRELIDEIRRLRETIAVAPLRDLEALVAEATA